MGNSTRPVVLQRVGLIMALPAVAFVLLGWSGPVDNEPVIAVSSTIPDELNPPLSTSSGSASARWRAAGGEGSMMSSTQSVLGSIVSLWRYPVKSMMGEELNASEVTRGGLLGDRSYALIDTSDGKVATAKNPRKWPQLFNFRAALTDAPRIGVKMSPVRITLPDGTIVHSEQPDLYQVLSKVLKREVTLDATVNVQQEIDGSTVPDLRTATAEEYWADIEGLEHRDTVTDFGLPEGTFFDCAVVHLLTTATLDRLRELYPPGRFEVRRFRPNIVVEAANGEKDFVENAWVGQVLAIGDSVRLSITVPCGRCVMTTLPQGDLPRDTGILRAAAQHNRANVGVYASVLQGGKVCRGDSIRLEQAHA